MERRLVCVIMLLLKTISLYQMNLLLLIHNVKMCYQRSRLLRELIGFSGPQLTRKLRKEENVESFESCQVELHSDSG